MQRGPRLAPELTLVIDTPQGDVSGASVVEVRVAFDANPSRITGREVSNGLTGEATVVEVLPGRSLFALLDGSEERFAAAAKDRLKGMTRGEWLRLIPVQTEPVALTGDLIPMLVTFADISKPETVRLVDPADLSATLGPYPEPALGPETGGATNIPFYRKVHMGDFIRRAH